MFPSFLLSFLPSSFLFSFFPFPSLFPRGYDWPRFWSVLLPSFPIPFRTRDGWLPLSSCSRSPFLSLFFSLFVYTYINIYVYICIKAFPSRRGRCRGYESAPSPDARTARQLDKHPDDSHANLGSGDTPRPREGHHANASTRGRPAITSMTGGASPRVERSHPAKLEMHVCFSVYIYIYIYIYV